MRYVGFNIKEDLIDKLKVVSFMKGRNRTQLVKEGIKLVIDKYSDSFDDFEDYVYKMKNK